mgnify:CR=1 FL=1
MSASWTPGGPALEKKIWRLPDARYPVGAGWLIDFDNGLAANDWGIYTDVVPGEYQVCFGAVPEKTAPPCQNTTVSESATTTVTGTYT